MRLIKPPVYFFVLLLITLVPVNAAAQLFGSDEENWKKVFHELKKINSRLVTLEAEELSNVRSQLEDLLRQIEEIKQILPQLQGAVELNKSEALAKANRLDSKISDLEAEVKNQVLYKISRQNKILENVKQEQKNLKEGLAQDMEQFEKVNKENFQNFASTNKSTLETIAQRLVSLDETTKKSFEDTKGLFISDVIPAMAKENQDNRTVILQHLSESRETNEKALENLSTKNQKLIDILGESLIQGADTKNQVEAIGKNVASVNKNVLAVNKNLDAINKNISVNNKNQMVADEKMNKLAETLKALRTQHSASNETLATLKDTLAKAQEFDQLENEKINKLIENSAQMTVQANQLEQSIISELKQSSQKEDSNQDKIDLANEKLSRLIEILKAIATEQGKTAQLVDNMGQVVKAQSGLKKAQAGLVKNQEGIKEALADLRRKANVNISRNDDIKKILGEMKKK
ncbi:MAG: hypothetical protein F3743_11575 [Nitrospinae bacterium]|nr:hypothetical protein [Nitrospinota bacterium]